MDLKTGQDIHMNEQKEVFVDKQKDIDEESVANHLLLAQCVRLRKFVRKEVYRDLMYVIGQSYMPEDVLEEEK